MEKLNKIRWDKKKALDKNVFNQSAGDSNFVIVNSRGNNDKLVVGVNKHIKIIPNGVTVYAPYMFNFPEFGFDCDYFNNFSHYSKLTHLLSTLNKFCVRYDGNIKLTTHGDSSDFMIYLNNSKNLNIFGKVFYSDFGVPFASLIDICLVDNISRQSRFMASYLFRNYPLNVIIEIRVGISPYRSLPTITDIYSASSWLEREIWDMFGVPFSNHPDLRRMLTDYGFIGHPLRKDFPLSGYYEVRFNYVYNRVGFEKLNLKQEMRFYFFNDNPLNWYNDEKKH